MSEPGRQMKVYTAKSVARMLDLSVAQVRSYARAGFLEPERGPRGEWRFSFRDLLLLRTAKGLLSARVAPGKIRRALARLKEQLPGDLPLTGLQISAAGDDVVVRDGDWTWNPTSGQGCLDFGNLGPLKPVAPPTAGPQAEGPDSEASMNAEDWAVLGRDLEAAAPDHAREAYRRSLELRPTSVEVRVWLGRLLHEEGAMTSAEAHFRLALAMKPRDPFALFQLGICLEDQGRTDEAVQAYLETIDVDPACADAYHNLACLYEELGDTTAALEQFKSYRRLTDD
jgi:tetratricopeptide (TPR) repeat protein